MEYIFYLVRLENPDTYTNMGTEQNEKICLINSLKEINKNLESKAPGNKIGALRKLFELMLLDQNFDYVEKYSFNIRLLLDICEG